MLSSMASAWVKGHIMCRMFSSQSSPIFPFYHQISWKDLVGVLSQTQLEPSVSLSLTFQNLLHNEKSKAMYEEKRRKEKKKEESGMGEGKGLDCRARQT